MGFIGFYEDCLLNVMILEGDGKVKFFAQGSGLFMVNRTYAILTIGCSVIEEKPQKIQTLLWHNLTNQNQNQRYEARVGFTGYLCLNQRYECLMAFAGV